jgi:hypothetical protein
MQVQRQTPWTQTQSRPIMMTARVMMVPLTAKLRVGTVLCKLQPPLLRQSSVPHQSLLHLLLGIAHHLQDPLEPPLFLRAQVSRYYPQAHLCGPICCIGSSPRVLYHLACLSRLHPRWQCASDRVVTQKQFRDHCHILALRLRAKLARHLREEC